MAKNTSFDVLRVNVLVSIVGSDGFHVDTLDLYAARARSAFIAAAAAELRLGEDVVKRDLGRVLLAAEGLVEEAIRLRRGPPPAAARLRDSRAVSSTRPALRPPLGGAHARLRALLVVLGVLVAVIGLAAPAASASTAADARNGSITAIDPRTGAGVLLWRR